MNKNIEEKSNTSSNNVNMKNNEIKQSMETLEKKKDEVQTNDSLEKITKKDSMKKTILAVIRSLVPIHAHQTAYEMITNLRESNILNIDEDLNVFLNENQDMSIPLIDFIRCIYVNKASLKDHSNFFSDIVQYIPLPYIRNTKLIAMKSNIHKDEKTMNDVKRGGNKMKHTHEENILQSSQIKWMFL